MSEEPSQSTLNRRTTPKELRQAISRMKRKLRREERRAKKVQELKKVLNTIAAQVNGYRNDPELR